MIATDHSKIKVFNIIMVLALAFALVAGAIAVKTVTTVSALNNIAPVAEAGPDQAVQKNLTYVAGLPTLGSYPTVNLDASWSYDPDGGTLSYTWATGTLPTVNDYTPANGWPTAGTGAVITPTGSPLGITANVAITTPGLYVFQVTVSDGTASASDWVVVVAGKTWFVSIFQASPAHATWDVGSDTDNNGTSPFYPTSNNASAPYIGPWRTITHAINDASVKQGDRILVSPNNGAGSQSVGPKYATGGFNESILIDKWLTVWSTYGRNDILTVGGNETTPPQYATTITWNAGPQVVKIVWPHGIADLTKTDGLNAERTGVIFGGDGHGFNIIGSAIGILAGAVVPAAWVATYYYGLGAFASEITDDGDNFVVTTAGTSGTAEPSWNTGTVGAITTDTNAPAWLANHAYILTNFVKPTVDNGFIYECTVAGTSNTTTEPIWPTTLGATIVDGTVTWTCRAALVWTYLGERGGADAVDIYQNRIEELSSSTGVTFIGIEVDNSKAPTVDDNIIHIDRNDAMGSLTGITLIDCDETLPNVVFYLTVGNVFTPNIHGGAQVIWNYITLADQNIIYGITLYDCPKSWVYHNTINSINVKKPDVGISDSIAIGILLTSIDPEDGCPFSIVDLNTIIISVDGNHSAWAKGISVEDSRSVKVTNNYIELNVQGETPLTLGGLLGVGISMDNSILAIVIGNTIDVDNMSTVASDEIAGLGEGVNGLVRGLPAAGNQLVDIQLAFDEIANGRAPIVADAGSLAIGIFAYLCAGIQIGNADTVAGRNLIDVDSQVNLTIDDLSVDCAGAALAQGITVLESNGALVAYNRLTGPDNTVYPGVGDVEDTDGDTVGVHSNLIFEVSHVTAPTPTPYIPASDVEVDGIGKSGAIGVLVYASAPLSSMPIQVLGNKMDVVADGDVYLSAIQNELVLPATWASSVLGQLDSAVEDMVTEFMNVAKSDQVNISGLVTTAAFDPDAFAKGRTFIFSIGVATLDSTSAVIAGNMIFTANANLVAQVIAETIPLATSTDDAVVANSDRTITLAIGILNYNCGMWIPVIPPTVPLAWESETTYALDDVVSATPDNGFDYVCVVAGTSGTTQPVWPTTPTYTILDPLTGNTSVEWLCTLRTSGNPVEVLAPTTVTRNLVVSATATSVVSIEAAQIVAHSIGGDVEAEGSGLAVGMGIVVIGQDQLLYANYLNSEPDELPTDAIVTYNSVHGLGNSTVHLYGYNLVDEQLASADGSSTGVGTGITVIGQAFPLISGNGDFPGIGSYPLVSFDKWEAGTPYILGDIVSPTVPTGFVYICTAAGTSGSTEPTWPNVVAHTVFDPTPNGPLQWTAMNYVTLDPASTGVCYVTGTGNALGTADASGLSAEDPISEIDSTGIGVGIATVFCIDPQITYNCNFHKNVYSGANNPGGGSEATPYNPWVDTFVTGMATANGVAGSWDNAILAGSQADNTTATGTTMAAGIGILIAACEGAYVTHNHAQGGVQGETPLKVTAHVDVLAREEDPLQSASTTALAFSLACGILIGDVTSFAQTTYWHIPFCVKESNTFEAGADVTLSSVSENPDPAALAAAIDAFIVYSDVLAGDVQDTDIQTVVFNYNDMPGLLLSGTSTADKTVVDFGMLVVNLTTPFIQQNEDNTYVIVDARYNYWGNPLIPTNYLNPATFNLTGPGGIGYGVGQPLYVVTQWFTAFVFYQPWLTINHEWCLDSHIGKFGKSIELGKCWNTFSVPIALDSVAVGSYNYNEWQGFKDLNNATFTANIGPALYYNAQTQAWVNLEANHELTPLEGYKVYVKSSAAALILASTDETMPVWPMWVGWNLVGPNPPFCDPGMHVGDFVSSLVRTDGYSGFSQVVSQGSSQPNWSYTLGDWMSEDDGPFMKIGKAYWVYMNSSDCDLAGFGFTRLPLYPEHFYHH